MESWNFHRLCKIGRVYVILHKIKSRNLSPPKNERFQFLRRRGIHFNIRWIHFGTISDEIIGKVKRSKIWIEILAENLFNIIWHWQDRRTVGEPVAESQFFQRRLSSLHLNRLIEGTEIFSKYVDKCVDL